MSWLWIEADLSGLPIALSLLVGCVLTIALYVFMIWPGPRLGLKL